MKRKAAEELVRDIQGQHMQIDQNLLLNGTDLLLFNDMEIRDPVFYNLAPVEFSSLY